MGIRMRAAIAAMAVTLAVSAQSRITDDGKEIYILTAARLKGSEASFSPKVYRYRDGAYELLAELPDARQVYGYGSSFQIAGDGSRFSVGGWFDSPTGSVIQTRIFNRDGSLVASLNNAVVSEGGRFACQRAGSSSPPSYECGPVDGNGPRFPIPANGDWILELTDTGHVLTSAPGDVYSIWNGGTRRPLAFRSYELGQPPVLSRDGSYVLAVRSGSVFRKDIATGEERKIIPP